MFLRLTCHSSNVRGIRVNEQELSILSSNVLGEEGNVVEGVLPVDLLEDVVGDAGQDGADGEEGLELPQVPGIFQPGQNALESG